MAFRSTCRSVTWSGESPLARAMATWGARRDIEHRAPHESCGAADADQGERRQRQRQVRTRSTSRSHPA